MKHKQVRIFVLILALLLIAGSVFAARMASVRAAEETSVEQPTDPPVTDPPVTDPPATDPPVTDPPVTDPPVTDPPVTDPPVTDPPVTEPPVTEPPVTEPPVTEPPVTEPPVTEPPVTETTPEETTPEQTTPEQTTPEQTTPEETTPEQTTDGATEHTHSYSETGRTDATCTDAGQITYTCSGCGESYTETIPAKGHSFGDWKVEKEAGYETSGLKKRACPVCGHEETEEIPATGYPEGSVVNVAFTVTGGKFKDGTTQKTVTVILWTSGGKASPNGVGHLTQDQIPTDMIPNEGYDNGFWADPVPSTSVNITQNTTFAYSYTGNFNYDGTYTSYHGYWRPTQTAAPQPTQPRPTQTQPPQTQPTSESETTEEETEEPTEGDGEIVITGGEAGEYGELISMNGENLLIYRLPKGNYSVTNEGDGAASLSIFSNKTVTNADGKEEPAENFENFVVTKDAAPVSVFMDADRYATLTDGAVLRFVLEEEPTTEMTTEEPTTSEVATEPATVTDPASESAEASESEYVEPEPDRDNNMVLWPFILILGILVIGLGVLIFFIIRLLKKSGADEKKNRFDDED